MFFSDFDLNELQVKEPPALKNKLQSAQNGLSPPCFDGNSVDDKPILVWVKPLLKFFQKTLKGVARKTTLKIFLLHALYGI